MNLLRKALVPLAGVAVVALVISVAGPRTVRAITATLVQVTNTVPVIVAPSAPQLYESNCITFFGSTQEAKCSFATVPAGNTLFIDAVTMNLSSLEAGAPQASYVLTWNTGPSYPEGQATNGGSNGNALFVPLTKMAPGFGNNYQGTFSTVSVWAADSPVPKCVVLLDNPSVNGQLVCTVWGHLAPIPGGGT
jgi:hypothetical protein